MKDIYISTYSGKQFFPFAPKVEDVDIEDIAHALSHINRWIGHTVSPYSVAAHSVHVAKLIESYGGSRSDQLWGLLHDASEAYFGDIASPIKNAFKELVHFEHKIQEVIAKAFGLAWPMPPIIHKADKESLIIEANHLFVKKPRWVNSDPGMLPTIQNPHKEFLALYSALGGTVPIGLPHTGSSDGRSSIVAAPIASIVRPSDIGPSGSV